MNKHTLSSSSRPVAMEALFMLLGIGVDGEIRESFMQEVILEWGLEGCIVQGGGGFQANHK